MFGSISLATPNSTVTSSFTAGEVCKVGVGAGYTVRVNGQVVTPRLIDLVAGDLIEIDVTAAGAGGYKFVPWTYDGNRCHFAVVSRQASTKPSLVGIYRGKPWYDFAPTMGHLASKIETNGIETTLDVTNNEATPRTVDTANILDVQGGYLFYYEPGISAPRRRIGLGGKPLSLTRMFNGATRTWENYVLMNDGYIQKIAYDWTVTRSTAPIVDAKCIFSDGTTLYVGGINYIKVLSDQNTISASYPVASDTITYGAAASSTAMFSGTSGKIYKLQGSTITPVYDNGTTIGAPTVFQSQFVFPLVEEYKLKVFGLDGSFVRDLDTGDQIPWSVSANRNTSLVVTYADSKSVDVFTTLTGTPTPTTVTFARKVTFAQQVSGVTYAHHYLREFALTMPANPPVSGVNFPTWNAPVDVDTGSGESTVVTQAVGLQAAVSPNAVMFINSQTGIQTISNDNRVAVMMRSQEGKKSAAVVLGNYAFDFKVFAEPTEAFSTEINIDNKFVAPQSVFTITVPKEVVNAPVAISHGTMKLNGSAYNGTTPVNTGDVLTITINVPNGFVAYWSILSIADSQYAMTMSTSSTLIADTQRYQPYLSQATKSLVKVNETGTYYFPNYSHASVSKDGNLLTFPVDLVKDDEVEITHTPMSAWWFDRRDTVLIGPNTVYEVRGITAVDDAPDDVDFGFVHLGIPDFPSIPDQTAVIAGLSDKFTVTIFGQNMQFSINGGPLTERPTVKNGDVVQVTYTVLNLWETRYVKTTLYDGREYEFGAVHVDPPLGINFDPAHESFFLPTYWVEVDQAHEINSGMIVPLLIQDKPLAGVASISSYAGATSGTKTPSAISTYGGAINEAKTPSAVSTFGGAINEVKTQSAVSFREPAANQMKTALPKADIYLPFTHGRIPTSKPALNQYAPLLYWDIQKPGFYEDFSYIPVDIRENYNSGFGYQAGTPRYVDAYWEPVQTITGKSIQMQYEHAPTKTELLFAYGPVVLSRASYLPVVKTFLFESAQAQKKFNPLWSFDHSNTVFVNEDSGVYTFMNWNHEQPVDMKPVYETPAKSFPIVLQPKFALSATQIFYTNESKFSQDATLEVEASKARYVTDILWKNSEPLKTGGYATLQAAFDAGKAQSGNLEVQSYQQPEGTFSYIIKRETNLTCPIIESEITAGKWLLGGG